MRVLFLEINKNSKAMYSPEQMNDTTTQKCKVFATAALN